MGAMAAGRAAAAAAVDVAKGLLKTVEELKTMCDQFNKSQAKDVRRFARHICFNETIRVDCNQPRVFTIGGGRAGKRARLEINRSSDMTAHQEGYVAIADEDGFVLHQHSFRSDKGGLNVDVDVPGACAVTLVITSHHCASGLVGGFGGSSTSNVSVRIC